jgi:Arc/MetJ-type ribon-helix-helix transcriptional regulator
MKLSVSLPGEDVGFLDEYARTHSYPSRSAVVHQAIEMLRADDLCDAYQDAWAEWARSGEASRWEATTGDGV